MRQNFTALVMMLLAMLPVTSCAQTPETKQQTMETLKDKKVLVAFFSRANENYAVGHIETGNTQIVAEMIAAATGGRLFHIEPAVPYPANYEACTETARRELNSNARPAIKGDVPAETYDIIFLGYPNWWGDMPMPVYTFIEKHSWQRKTVVPFCTHEGSGLGATAGRVQRACRGATVLPGLAVRGATAQNARDDARRAVTKWLKSLNF